LFDETGEPEGRPGSALSEPRMDLEVV